MTQYDISAGDEMEFAPRPVDSNFKHRVRERTPHVDDESVHAFLEGKQSQLYRSHAFLHQDDHWLNDEDLDLARAIPPAIQQAANSHYANRG